VTVAALLTGGIARADAQVLLAHVLRRDRAWLAAHPEAEPSAEEAQSFEDLRAQRAGGMPIAYILGNAGFYGREFRVDDRVLVPRPETEHLVDEAIAFVRGPMRVLDVGTGCGAIACTIAAETSAQVDATEICTGAIEVAKENARRLDVEDRCTFHLGDLAEPVRGNRYDAIVANLPYVPTADVPRPPDPASFEPRIALDGGPDGLALYRKLIPQLRTIVNKEALILLEATPPTINELATLLCHSLPDFAISVVPDYANLPRYVRAQRSRF
jgi:release factor glutamine methyltransferase